MSKIEPKITVELCYPDGTPINGKIKFTPEDIDFLAQMFAEQMGLKMYK